MPVRALQRIIPIVLLSFVILSPPAGAQKQPPKPAAKKHKIPVIPDQPRTVDPVQFLPKKLATAVTVKFDGSSLREVGEWIAKEQKIPVLFDKEALADQKIPLGEAVNDRLDKEPLYLLLNRLSSLGLAWYVKDDILHITTIEVAGSRMSTKPYNVGDLLDAGYKRDAVLDVARNATAGPWMDEDGVGGKLEWLGDVLFVRQTDRMHREIQGLLSALRKHGRQTFSLDPPQHEALRKKLGANVSVNFDQTPLTTAVKQLAQKSGTDIRLDVPTLRKKGIHERQPVTLKLSERKLETVLGVLLAELKLTSVLRDGVMSITSEEKAEELHKTAVYDVRDLCRNEKESAALTTAIQSQTKGPWFDIEGVGGTIVFARTGTMVIRHTERRLNEVGQLLTTYRKALRASKPRDRAEEKSREVITVYYRMHDGTATDLVKLLPKLVQPETWKTDAKPKAPGTILKVASPPGLLAVTGNAVDTVASTDNNNARDTKVLVVSHAVLVIRQSRAVHEEISGVIQRIEHGDPTEPLVGGGGLGGLGGGGGFGGGGFGSGFFSIR
ncbi:MAG: hypothetical protein ACE5KM_20675 [Planctomycetaceae bacterium]